MTSSWSRTISGFTACIERTLPGNLGNDAGDCGEPVAIEGAEGLQVGLGTRPAGRVGSGNGQDDGKGHGETKIETGDLKPEGIQRNRKA